MTDLRRRTGGVAAVVAAFWLGFVCGGGGSLPGAEATGGPAGPPPREPAPAPQPPQADPAPAEAQADPAPAEAQADPAPAEAQADPVPAESQADPAPAAPQADPVPAEAQADPAPAAPQADPVPAESQADPVPEEAPQADPAPEEATEEDAEIEETPGPELPVVQDRPREFTARTGMVLNFVRQDAESAYEETMARVAEAFAVAEDEEREQQAEGWSTYKAEEPLADGVRLYVSWVDPVVPGADYWVPAILSEAFPTEAQALYETYAGAFADGQILLNLVPVAGP